MRVRALLVSFLIAVFAAPTAFAGWTGNGVPVCPTCVYSINREPALAADGSGGFFAAWWGGGGIARIQHFLGSGDPDPAWPSAGVPPTGAIGQTYRYGLLADGAGGVFVAFRPTGCVAHCGAFEGGPTYLQRLTGTGVVTGGWPANGIRVPGVGTAPPLIAPDGSGGVLVLCASELFVDPVRVSRVTSGGSILWPAALSGGAVAPNAPASVEKSPALLTDGSGGAFVAWEDYRGPVPQIYLQHFDAAGNLFDSSGVAVTAALLPQRRPRLLADGAGGFFLAWEDSTAGAATDIRAQRFNALLQPQWGSGISVTPGVAGDQFAVALAGDGTSGFYLLWADRRDGNTRAYAVRLDGSGQPVAPWAAGGQPIHSGTISYSYANPLFPTFGFPNIVAAPGGGFYASWIETITMAIHIEADGSPAPGSPPDGFPMCTGSCGPIETGSYLAADGIGGAIAIWDEWRPGPFPGADFEDSFAARMGSDGLVATLASLVAADASPRGVHLEWQLNEPATLDVERSESATGPGASWSPLTRETSDASGRLVVDDRDVRAGARYGYRLVQRDGGNASILTTTWVTVPLEGALTLAGARPNPSAGDLNLAFSLRDGSSATLDLLDVAGRRVASRRLDGLGAGAHLLRMNEAARLPAGIYTARLTQAGRTVTTHVSLVR
jgi:hypothetical protein